MHIEDVPQDHEDRSTPIAPLGGPLAAHPDGDAHPRSARPAGVPALDASAVSSRDQARAIDGLKRLVRRSPWLSMQETLTFACAFMSDALALRCVAVVHDRARQPLAWGSTRVSDASPGRAASLAHRTYASLVLGAPDDAEEREATSAGEATTLPLAIPLLGVIRLEGEGLAQASVQGFLRHAVILLSLALARGVDCERRAGEPAVLGPSTDAQGDHPYGLFSSALAVAQALARTLDGGVRQGHGSSTDAIRLARAMTLNVIDLLELDARSPHPV